VMWRSD